MGTIIQPTLLPPAANHSWHFHEETLNGRNFFVLQLVDRNYTDIVLSSEKISHFDLKMQVDVFRKTPQEIVDSMARKIIANS